MRRLKNKVAIVTAAGEGIGLKIASDLASVGAKVVVNDLDKHKAKEACRSIRSDGAECFYVTGNSADQSTIDKLISAATENFGQLDIAVANAGITHWSNFFDYKAEDLNEVINVNLVGTFLLAQSAARLMRSQKTGGKILLMSSVTGYQAIEYLSAYAMTKAAIRMLAKQLVIELSPHGICVNAIAPGATATPRNLADDPNFEQAWSKLTPGRRAATVEDIANAALFLLSPEASHITGQTLIVDGGWTSVSPVPDLDFVESD